MNEFNGSYASNSELTFNEYLAKVFSVVAIGVGITAITSFVISKFFLVTLLTKYGEAFFTASFILLFIEIGIALFFGLRLRKMAKSTAWLCYIIYSFSTGVSLSTVLYAYTETSVWLAFAITTLMFITMSIIGHNTKSDLNKFSGLILPGLLFIIIISVLNVLFFRSQMIQWVVNYAGVILFLFLIAYDMQKLRDLYQVSFQDGEMGEKMMIYGAFQLYLDFINLFLRLLELFGKKRDD